jgi:UDP-3-O-[3-hydroxymyristoyl] glucosamine N-acyltransferase
MSVTLKEIVNSLGGELVGDDVAIDRVSSIANAQQGNITFITDSKYREELKTTKASAVILEEENLSYTDLPCIVTDNPYAYFAKLLALLNPKFRPDKGAHASAIVGGAAQIPDSCAIGANVVIGANVILGEDVVIGANCNIGDGVYIGNKTELQANVTIYQDCVIGKNCTFAAGVVIGADGFGYANQKGEWVKIPQVGRVIIKDNVDIGANTSIDRGALDDTVIEQGVKLDNLIQVGHNCVIGEHTVIAGCVGIAGSAKIGKHCKIGGAAMILGHLEIADGVTISPGSMITRSIHQADTYTALMPFQAHGDWLKTAANLRRLDEMANRIKLLEKQIAEINKKDS